MLTWVNIHHIQQKPMCYRIEEKIVIMQKKNQHTKKIFMHNRKKFNTRAVCGWRQYRMRFQSHQQMCHNTRARLKAVSIQLSIAIPICMRMHTLDCVYECGRTLKQVCGDESSFVYDGARRGVFVCCIAHLWKMHSSIHTFAVYISYLACAPRKCSHWRSSTNVASC